MSGVVGRWWNVVWGVLRCWAVGMLGWLDAGILGCWDAGADVGMFW